MNICCIVGAGDFTEYDFQKQKGDLIIAADGGYEHLKKLNIKPDIAVGDFDSLGYKPTDSEVVELPAEKDVTDMKAAVDIGIKCGYKEFVIYGGCGGRIDHTLSNIQMMAWLSQHGFKCNLRNGKTVLQAISNSKVNFDSTHKGYISVFSHSDLCDGVTIKGLKYNLENAQLNNTFSLGVSNEFIGTESEISVKSGTIIVIYSC